MNTLPEVRGAPPSVDHSRVESAQAHGESAVLTLPVRTRPAPRRQRIAHAVRDLRYPLGVYALARALYLAIALLVLVHGWSLGHELRNWDGKWYIALVEHGYPQFVAHGQTTLGFFPLYPMLTWLVAHVLFCGYVVAGVMVSLGTGAVATVLIYRLAQNWFGEAGARRGILFFSLFPGTIVFSMVYTEGLLLALVAGCVLALQRRRWATAGLLAGLSTAVGPVAVAIIPACAFVALHELRRHGWRDRQARRALLAPLLSPLGLVAFGAFLWYWTGSPFASYIAQHDGWKEHSSPLALYWIAHHLWMTIRHFHWSHPGIDLNDIAGLLGAAFLVWSLVILWRHRARVPLMALVWTVGVAILTVTSDQTPPNARMLMCAFPLLLVVGYRLRGVAFRRLIACSTLLLVVMSVLTFVSSTSLRP